MSAIPATGERTTEPVPAPAHSSNQVEGPPRLTDRWRALKLRWQVVIVVVAVLCVLPLLLGEVGSLYSSPSSSASGPSSTFDTSASGAAALSYLLAQRHHPVTQLSSPILDTRLPAGATLFVLDPASSIQADADAIGRFLRSGGHVVLGGQPEPAVLAALVPTALRPTWEAAPAGPSHPTRPVPENRGIATVQAPGSGTWRVPEAAQGEVFLAGRGGPLGLVLPVGNGRLVLLANDEALENALLASADDAAFGLNLAGRPRSPVVFDEYDHGFGRSGTGLAGLPAHWKVALAIGLLAAVVWLLSASRRLGPPTNASPRALPPRIAHVDALAELLASGSPEQVSAGAEPLRRRARDQIVRILHAPTGAADEILTGLAEESGATSMPPDLVRSVLAEPHSADDLLTLSRALAALEHRVSTKGSDP